MTGTMIGYGISAISLPILTRIYSPEDFSVLASFTAIVSILAVSASLRFNVAISIPTSRAIASDLLRISILVAAASSFIVAAVLLIFQNSISSLLSQPRLSDQFWLIPIAVFLAATFSTFQFWHVREQKFKVIAKARVLQSFLASGIQISLGILGFSPFGLVFGYSMNNGTGAVYLGQSALTKTLFSPLRRNRVKRIFAAYKHYPKYSSLEALLNTISTSLPILLIGSLSSDPVTGHLALAVAVLQAPMALLGGSISQVFLSRAPIENRNGTLVQYSSEVLTWLFRACIGPLVALAILAPDFFRVLFGENWERSGELVRWMVPWYVLQFAVSPISMALYVKKHLLTALLLQFFGALLRSASILVVFFVGSNLFAESYALSGLVFYLIYLIVVLRVIAIPLKTIFKNLVYTTPILVLCIAIALVLSVVLKGV